MKLIAAIINQRDARRLRETLVETGQRFTEIASTGGYLREGGTTLLLGVADDQVEAVLELIARHCHAREQVVSVAQSDTRMYANPVAEPITVSVGGAMVFVLDVERLVQF